jgi:serine/threonine protein kinase
MTPVRPPLLRDRNGNTVSLGPIIGQGGEATVYSIPGQPQKLAKIYRVTPAGYELKLTWMVTHPPVQTATHVEMAGPTELVYDKGGTLQGFLMPRIASAVPLLVIFNPRKRAQLLPNFDLRYRYRAARNLAAAVQAAHDAGYVVGDLNESNALVASTALVTLLDTDSFQVRVPQGKTTRLFRSPVGKPEYTPPELQGLHFQSVDRTPAHDRFALGVLIYQLLMDGNHPFRLLWRGSGDPPSLEDSIRHGWFPYAAAPSMIAPPPHAPGLNSLDTSISALVRRCFVEGQRNPDLRPTAADWQQALGVAETALRSCGSGHLFAVTVAVCPTCTALSSAKRTKRVKKPSRSKTPKKLQAAAVPPPPPFSPPPSSRQGPTPTPARTLQSAPAKKKRNWIRWLFLIITAIWIWNAMAGGSGTGPERTPTGAPRSTATAQVTSVPESRTPTPVNSQADNALGTWGFTDPFVDPSAFAPVMSDGVTANIADGVFNLSVATPGDFYWIEYLDDPVASNDDFGTRVDVEQFDGVGEFFLRVKSMTSGDQWFFAVNPDESSWLLYLDSATSAFPFVWITPRRISPLGNPTSIGIQVRNGIPTFLVTGTNVVPPSVNMPRLSGSFVVGFGIHAAPEFGATMTAQFDNFRVYAI